MICDYLSNVINQKKKKKRKNHDVKHTTRTPRLIFTQ